MKLKEFSDYLIKRNESNRSNNIMIVGPLGFGLDNLCVSLAEEISSKSKKINFKDENYFFENISCMDFNKFKNSVIIQTPRRMGILSEIEIHRRTSLILSTSRQLNNIFILRDIMGLNKSTLIRLFDFKITVSYEGDIFIECLGNGKVDKLDFDLRKQNKKAESLRLDSLNKMMMGNVA